MNILKSKLNQALSITTLNLSLLIVSPQVVAQEFTPYEIPQGCEYGRSSDSDLPVSELATAIAAGLNAYYNTSPDSVIKAIESSLDLINSTFESFDYLRIETPSYVLQNTDFQAKGNLFDQFANVRFHNSELGYVGKDKSSIEANAYYNMKFPNTYGTGLVWITRGDNTRCSVKSVNVQKLPEVTNVDLTTGYQSITTNVTYNVDQFSKAYIEPNENVKFILSGYNSDTGGNFSQTYSISETQGTASFITDTNSGGSYDLTLTINDGTFSKSISLGSNFVRGPFVAPCPTCQIF